MLLSSSSEKSADSTTRRIQRALEYVEDRWFPVNETLLEVIRKGFQQGRYDLDLDFLVDDLKNDLSLFVYCIRELAACYQQEEGGDLSQQNPIELIRWGGAKRLQQILSKEAAQISTHALASTSKLQKSRLSETLLSASAVETLSENTSVSSELGFSSSVLRNLGLLLISWNYPTIYAQAVEHLDESATLDVLLSDALGFSPLLLGAALLKRWGLPEWWIGADEQRTEVLAPETQSVLCVLEKLHNIGEALARANDPATYPSAAQDWTIARKGILDALGQQGLSRIQESLESRCKYYRKALPTIFPEEIQLDAERKIWQLAQEQLHLRNPYIRRCSLEVRTKLEQIYKLISREAILSEPIRILTKQVLPYCGFSGCAVYVYDPGLTALVPRMQTGRLDVRKAYTVPYSPESKSSDFISSAFECKTPLLETQRGSIDQELVYIGICLGQSQKTGVLYLEMPQIVSLQLSTDVLTLARAIAQTLMDCLHIS